MGWAGLHPHLDEGGPMTVSIRKVRFAAHQETRGWKPGVVHADVDGYHVLFTASGWSCTCTRTSSSSDTSTSSSDACRHVEQVRMLINPQTLDGIRQGQREGAASERRKQRVEERKAERAHRNANTQKRG